MTRDVYSDLFDDDFETALNDNAVARVWAQCGQRAVRLGVESTKPPGIPGGSVVAPTGVDPVTFRFSVGRSTN